MGLSRNSAGLDPIFPTQGSNIEASIKFTPPYSLFSNKDYSTMSAVDKYKWLEFYKVKLKADIYNTVVGKLVLRSSAEMGFLNGYNKELGAPPFERFYPVSYTHLDVYKRQPMYSLNIISSPLMMSRKACLVLIFLADLAG